MDFKELREFYKLNLFVDLAINVSDEEGRVSHVCQCHKLVFASVFPAFQNVLEQEEDASILFEKQKFQDIKNTIDAIYDSLADTDNPLPPFATKDLKEWIVESKNNYSFSSIYELVENWNEERDFQVTMDQHGCPDNYKFAMACAITKVEHNVCNAKILGFHSTVAHLGFSPSRTSRNMIEMIRNCTEASIPDVLNMLDTSKNYVEFTKAPLEYPPIFQMQSKQNMEREDISDFLLIYGNEMDELKCQTIQDVKIILKMWARFCGLQSVRDLKETILIKSLFQIHKPTQQVEFEMQNKETPNQQIPKLNNKVNNRKKIILNKTTKELICENEGCDKKFEKYEAFRAHMRSYHHKVGSGVPCDKCGTMYQNFFFLKRHKRLAHDEAVCKECGLKFSGSNELSRHNRKEHLTGNEHICELCGMGFKVKTYLKRHLRQQHPGSVKSPFVCRDCDKPFGTGRKLRDHIQVFHVKTRPHKCRAGPQVCEKSFTTINMRRRHEKQVHKLLIYTPSGTKSKFTVEPPINDDS